MTNVPFFKLDKFPILLNRLNVNEFKFIYSLAYYLMSTNKSVYTDIAENREALKSLGFNRSQIRIKNLLNSLVNKNILTKEDSSVYSFNRKLITL